MAIINRMAIWICVGIYEVVSYAFRIFLLLAQNELFDTASYSNILKNFYIIIGVVMLFVLSFALLRGMVNPDEQKQGTAMVKKVIVNLITSFIGLAVLPTIFSFAYDFQDSFIMTQNVFGQIFGYSTSASTDGNIEQGANKITNGVFTAFFREDPSVGEAFNSDNVSLSDIKAQVDINGNFTAYTDFADAVTNGKVIFNFLISLLAGLFFIYIAVSFCFDMALRAVKLFFYQLIAPLPLFFRIMPEGKLSGVFGNWVKVLLTCYLEVYIRVLVFYLAVFLCRIIIDTSPFAAKGETTSLMANAFIIMGIVLFMKQAPKLLSEVTGLDSGNMKLGIPGKLKEAGVFSAAKALGVGATALGAGAIAGARNAFHARSKWDDVKDKGFKEKAKVVGSGILSTIAGASSGFVKGVQTRPGKIKDIPNNIVNAAQGATSARAKRESYAADKGNTLKGVAMGHVQDVITRGKELVGIGVGDEKLGYYETAAQATDSYNSLSESTYKKKQEYVDQSSVVKRLDAEYKTLSAQTNERIKRYDEQKNALLIERNNSTTTDARRLEIDTELKNIETNRSKLELDLDNLHNSFKFEETKLEELQRSMSVKKKDIISVAATRLSVDQRVNYSNDSQIQDSYREALYKSFVDDFDSLANLRGTREENREIINANGQKETVSVRFVKFIDKKGNEVEKEISGNDKKIFDAMYNGQEVDAEWINEDNVLKVQDALDKANTGRQHVKTEIERKHIVETGNRSTDKKSGS